MVVTFLTVEEEMEMTLLFQAQVLQQLHLPVVEAVAQVVLHLKKQVKMEAAAAVVLVIMMVD